MKTRTITLMLREVRLHMLLSAILVVPFAGAGNTVQGVEFDASAKSPAFVLFDPNRVVQAHNMYVSGGDIVIEPGPFTGTNINSLLGANRFYAAGYTGTNAVIANIEAGHAWTGHETLTHARQILNHPQSLNEFDLHSTAVSMVLAGRPGGANPGVYQEGLAPNAQLYSGAFASQWEGERYALSFWGTSSAFFDQYRRAFSVGVNTTGRRADVVNSSWLFDDPAAIDPWAIGFDGLANMNPHTLNVVAAGNSGPDPNTVGAPASGYNSLSVGALSPDPTYMRPADWTSAGPNDYADPVHGTVNGARQVVHIAAPGEFLSLAWYGGESGGNGTTDNPSVPGPGPTGPPIEPVGGPDFYGRGGWAGTSFASPTVAGGAALLYDASYAVFPSNPNARDARVVKSVLMNSALKTDGWDNGQIAHTNGNGGVFTSQGLDNRVGTGRMDLQAAFDQYFAGTTDVPTATTGNQGPVDGIGWDFGNVTSATTNDYYFHKPLLGGSTFTATLNWFRDRRINSASTAFDDSFDNLDLELWSVVSGVPTALVSESSSMFNSSEHFSFQLPTSGEYALRVRWSGELFDLVNDPNQEFYGVAWSGIYQDAGDFNEDGNYDCDDINGLVSAIVEGTHDRTFDLTGDHRVNLADRDVWLAVAGAANLPSGNPYLLADANLDGAVDGSDFSIWNANKFTTVSAWCSADFNADGAVDGSDFGIWNANKFLSSSETVAVPEPTSALLVLIACACWGYCRSALGWNLQRRSNAL